MKYCQHIYCALIIAFYSKHRFIDFKRGCLHIIWKQSRTRNTFLAWTTNTCMRMNKHSLTFKRNLSLYKIHYIDYKLWLSLWEFGVVVHMKLVYYLNTQSKRSLHAPTLFVILGAGLEHLYKSMVVKFFALLCKVVVNVCKDTPMWDTEVYRDVMVEQNFISRSRAYTIGLSLHVFCNIAIYTW